MVSDEDFTALLLMTGALADFLFKLYPDIEQLQEMQDLCDRMAMKYARPEIVMEMLK